VSKAGGSLASSSVMTLPDAGLGFHRGAVVRDPDGHALLLTEP